MVMEMLQRLNLIAMFFKGGGVGFLQGFDSFEAWLMNVEASPIYREARGVIRLEF